MRLYFLRHADALDAPDDAVRPLSPRGKEETKVMARFLEKAGVELEAAYSSPLVRARQTAEGILKSHSGVKLERVEIAEALLNETSPKEFSRWLKQLPDLDHVLLVGHAPSLAERVCDLLGVNSCGVLNLPKAGLACVETEDRHCARLKFFVSPKTLGYR